MAAHFGELFVVELARLVQDIVRNLRLADIVQHAAERNLADHVPGQLHGLAENHQQRTDADRVLEGVVVVAFQPDQRQQRILVAEDRLDGVLDQRRDTSDLDGLAETYILDDVAHHLVGFAVQATGLGRFLAQFGNDVLDRRLFREFLQTPVKVGIDLLLRRRLAHPDTTRGIDIHLANTQANDLVHGRLVAHGKRVRDEGMIEPATIEVVDVHPRFELVRADEIDHGYRAWRTAPILARMPIG